MSVRFTFHYREAMQFPSKKIIKKKRRHVMAAIMRKNKVRNSSAIWPDFGGVSICSAAALGISDDVFLL